MPLHVCGAVAADICGDVNVIWEILGVQKLQDFFVATVAIQWSMPYFCKPFP